MKIAFLIFAVGSLYFIVEANKPEGKSPIDIGEQVVGIGIGMIAGTFLSRL